MEKPMEKTQKNIETVIKNLNEKVWTIKSGLGSGYWREIDKRYTTPDGLQGEHITTAAVLYQTLQIITEDLQKEFKKIYDKIDELKK